MRSLRTSAPLTMHPPTPAVLILFARGKLRHARLASILAQTGSMRAAGEALGVSPASLAPLLSELEDLLQTELFRTDGDRAWPTSAARALLPQLRNAAKAVAAGTDALAVTCRGERPVVRMLSAGAGACELLRHALPPFSARYARVRVDWREAGEGALAEAIAHSGPDLVAGPRPCTVPAGWTFRVLAPERFAILCAAGCPLAGKPPARHEALAAHGWLLPPPGSGAREAFDESVAPSLRGPVNYCVVSSAEDMARWLLCDRDLLAFGRIDDFAHLLRTRELAQVPVEERGVEVLGLLQPCCSSEPVLRLAGFLQHFVASSSSVAREGRRVAA